MSYNLLTINNITKICDDRYFINPVDNKLTELQWFDFQLYFLIDYIRINSTKLAYISKNESENLSIIDPITGYKYTRNQIYDKIIKIYNSNKITIEPSLVSESTLKEYGLYKIDTFNKYSYNSIGGKAYPDLVINKTYNVDKPQKYMFDIDITPNHLLKEKDIIKKIKSNKLSRVKMELKTMSNTSDTYLKFGKFEWKNNSCYSDSILLPFIYYHITNTDTKLYNIIKNYEYTLKDITANNVKCNKESKSNTLIEINKIIKLFKNIISSIESGEIIDIYTKFMKTSYKICPNIFTRKFSDKQMHDPKEFFFNILEKLYNIGIGTFNQQHVYYISEDDSIKLNIDTVKIYNISTPMNETLFTRKMSHSINHDIICINVNPEIIRQIYVDNLPERGMSNKYNWIDENLTSDSKYQQDFFSGKYILKDSDSLFQKSRDEIQISLSYFIIIRSIQDLSMEEAYKYNDEYEETVIQSIRYYYNKKDKGNVGKYMKSSEINKDHGFKIVYKIEENIVNNECNHLYFSIERLLALNTFSDIKIKPDEFINISGTIYELQSIVLYLNLHYISIIKLNGNFYVYDDLYDFKKNKSYLTKIGPFVNLSNYSYNKFTEVILRRSVFIHYSKQIMY